MKRFAPRLNHEGGQQAEVDDPGAFQRGCQLPTLDDALLAVTASFASWELSR